MSSTLVNFVTSIIYKILRILEKLQYLRTLQICIAHSDHHMLGSVETTRVTRQLLVTLQN